MSYKLDDVNVSSCPEHQPSNEIGNLNFKEIESAEPITELEFSSEEKSN